MKNKCHEKSCAEAVEAFITAGGANGRKLSTLGKRSDVTFGKDGGGLYCQTSSGRRMIITTEYIQATCERYDALIKETEPNTLGTRLHLATGQYTGHAWDACPHFRICPYIAAIIAHLAGNHP